jgi:purine-binding chemotaxis protein CheW
MKNRSAKTRPGSKNSMVAFLVGEVHYAIDVQHVLQVVNPMGVTSLPDMPRAIVGVAEHRGLVVPVVDLRLLFGTTAETTRRTKWILLELGGNVAGVVVDAVTGVFGTLPEEVRPAPDLGPGEARRPLSGVTSHEGCLVFLVDGALLHEMAGPAMGARLAVPSQQPNVEGKPR